MIVYNEPGLRLPIKSWCEDIEDSAFAQARNLAKLSFAFRHIALMPDCHMGYGMPIGGVLATDNVIIPNAVGVDIGCGMRAVKTGWVGNPDVEYIKKTMGNVRKAIPVGFNHHKDDQEWYGFDSAPNIPIIQQQISSARRQLGTLGGGNHFIELQHGNDNHLWLMIHSGSRNFGFKTANYFHKIAKELCERWNANIPDKDLAFLPLEDVKFNLYQNAMNYALDFAHANRGLMMTRFKECVADVFPVFDVEDEIDVHHNYARVEHHFNKNVMVHRKGAISARAGEVGIVPGSQGTKSYIVEGLGEKQSFTSSSHGAGRTMGRNQARKTLDLVEQKQRLDSQGIIHSIRNVKDLDEAPGAYKDIDVVMKAQEDLVKVKVELTPLGVIKA